MSQQNGNKNTSLGEIILDNKGQGFEVGFAYVDKPMIPKKPTQSAKFKVDIVVNQQQINEILAIFEPIELQIDQMYPNSSRKIDYFKPKKDKQGNVEQGLFLLSIDNLYPPRVFDGNNNMYDVNPPVFRGSRVFLSFDALPFEFPNPSSGKLEHGISRTRLRTVKVLEFAETGGANPYGTSTGEQVAPPQRKQNNTPTVGQPNNQGGFPQPANQGYPAQQQPNYGQPAQQPNYGQPAQQQPNYGQPAQQPNYGQPAQQQNGGGFPQPTQQPNYGQPAQEQNSAPYGQPVQEQNNVPNYGQPAQEQNNQQQGNNPHTPAGTPDFSGQNPYQ